VVGVLDFGKLIFEGTPTVVQDSDIAGAACLGGDVEVRVVRLDVGHVRAAYGDIVSLREVSVTIPSGSVVALLSPNGAGKSTLLKVVSGLVKQQAGTVSIHRQ